MNNLSLGSQHWVVRLNSAYDRVHAGWQKSVEDIVSLGREVLAAREALPKGIYTNMISNELKFSASMATQLIKIAENAKIFSHVKILPPHWGTLYRLSLLDDQTFDRSVEAGVIRPDMERSEVPAMSRNLSVGERPRGRPRKTIEGTATEVKPPPMPEPPPPQQPIAASSAAQPMPPPWEESSASSLPNEDDPAAIKLSNEALRRAIERQDQVGDDPEPVVQPFGSGDTITVTFARNRPDVNFWQGLLLALGEWTKLGSLDDLAPNAETGKSLALYDLTQFIIELDELNERLTNARNAA